MIDYIMGRLPANLIIICAFLVFLFPFLIKYLNKKILKIINPAWKKQDPS